MVFCIRWCSSRVQRTCLSLVLLLSLAVPGVALAAGGGKPATKLINVADTRALGPGVTKMLADIYNDNLLLFGLVVVVVMALMGAILGFTFDKAFGLLGINLGKLDHHE